MILAAVGLALAIGIGVGYVVRDAVKRLRLTAHALRQDSERVVSAASQHDGNNDRHDNHCDDYTRHHNLRWELKEPRVRGPIKIQRLGRHGRRAQTAEYHEIEKEINV